MSFKEKSRLIEQLKQNFFEIPFQSDFGKIQVSQLCLRYKIFMRYCYSFMKITLEMN